MTIEPGAEVSYTVTLTNEGSATWRNSGVDRVRLSAHFGTEDDRPGAAWENETRFELPREVPPDGSVQIEVTLRAPTATGDYVLRQRLVQEGVAWFDDIHRQPVEIATPAWQSFGRTAGVGVAWLAAIVAIWLTIGPWARRRTIPSTPPGDVSGR